MQSSERHNKLAYSSSVFELTYMPVHSAEFYTYCYRLPTLLYFPSLQPKLHNNSSQKQKQNVLFSNEVIFSSSSSGFISAPGHRISSVSGEERETSFLLQHLSVALQHSMQFFCTTPSCPRTVRTNSHSSSVLLLLTLGTIHPGVLKIFTLKALLYYRLLCFIID